MLLVHCLIYVAVVFSNTYLFFCSSFGHLGPSFSAERIDSGAIVDYYWHFVMSFSLLTGILLLLLYLLKYLFLCICWLKDQELEENLNCDCYFYVFGQFDFFVVLDKDRKSTRLNSSHSGESRMPSSA